MARSSILFALFLAACSRPAAPRPPPLLDEPAPANSVAAAPAPSPAPAAEAPPPEKRAPDPLPKLDSKELEEKLLFLSYICPTAVKRDEKGVQKVGCSTCVTERVKPDGTVAMDPADFYELRGWVKGSFTKPGADQIAATLDGCESHAENWGGTLIAEKRGPGYVMVRYDSGVHPDSCLSYRRTDARDILVCRWGDGHQSYWNDRIFTYDFTLGTEDDVSKGFEEVVNLIDNVFPSCLGVPPGEDVRSGRIEGYTFSDENRDGTPELVVEVSQIKGKPTPAYLSVCKKWTESPDGEGVGVDVSTTLGKRRKARLVFSYDGSKFVPTKATAGVLKGL